MPASIGNIRIEIIQLQMAEAQAKMQKGCEAKAQTEGPQNLITQESPKDEALQELKLKEQRILFKLRQRDREVRAHEEAHLLAAGRYARGGPHYEYVRGPDGRFYAVGGEVKIDTSPIPGDPKATLEKARVIKRAALAPVNPSPQDRMVAAQADRMAAKALMELQRQQLEAMKAKMKAQYGHGVARYREIISNLPPQVSLDIKV